MSPSAVASPATRRSSAAVKDALTRELGLESFTRILGWNARSTAAEVAATMRNATRWVKEEVA